MKTNPTFIKHKTPRQEFYVAKSVEIRYKQRKEILIESLVLLLIISLLVLFFFIGAFYNFGYSHFDKNISWSNPLVKQHVIVEIETTISGLGLGVVGASLQATTKNDLSGPTTLGFVPAIILGIYIPIMCSGNSSINFFNSVGAKFLFAIIFGFLMIIINFLLTYKNHDLKNNYVPLLVGFSIGVIFSVVCILLSNYNLAIQQSGYNTQGIWSGINNINNNIAYIEYGAPLILVPTIIIFMLSKYLNIVEKDRNIAKSLGVNVDLIYWIIGILSVIIVASSILMIGSIILLAIVTPHIARKLFRTTNYKMILPFSSLLCAMLLNLSYLVTNANNLLGINLVPILFSAPIFIVLLRKR